jgi:dUTP pyrophosphatase
MQSQLANKEPNEMIYLHYTTEEAAEIYGSGNKAGSSHAAAIDLKAMSRVVLLPGEQAIIETGIRLDMMGHGRCAALIVPRSGRGSKEGLVLGNTVGLIDQDYTGEIMVCAWARPTSGHVNVNNARIGGTPIHIERGERFAQLMIIPIIPTAEIVAGSGNLTETERGSKGFGSTGY